MAEIKSSVITEISGRLGNIVFYRRHNKNFARKWVKPADPKTASQRACRKNFSLIVRTWQSMNPEQKKSWSNYPQRKGSAYNAFISDNLKRINQGLIIRITWRKADYCFKSKTLYEEAAQQYSTCSYPVFSLVTASIMHGSGINPFIRYLFHNREGPFNMADCLAIRFITVL